MVLPNLMWWCHRGVCKIRLRLSIWHPTAFGCLRYGDGIVLTVIVSYFECCVYMHIRAWVYGYPTEKLIALTLTHRKRLLNSWLLIERNYRVKKNIKYHLVVTIMSVLTKGDPALIMDVRQFGLLENSRDVEPTRKWIAIRLKNSIDRSGRE